MPYPLIKSMTECEIERLESREMAGVRQFDEERTLDLALNVFWQKGLSATSMQDLAEATGVLRGSLYNAYQGKEQLFLKVFDRYRQRMTGNMAAALADPSIKTALEGFFDFIITSMIEGTPTRGCLTTKTAVDGISEIDTIRAALQGMLDDIESLLQARFALEEQHETLNLPAHEASRLVSTFTRGVVVMERVYQDEARLRSTAASMVKVLIKA
ncbi:MULTISPECIES: TetR/AcrR family transcriptional regulator [unclassified Pseudomonas]|uniref:TetR/AcrR family transcriptional regulator n=1 Tax=unclassified Pseudomonas TaxID=196821 RepID=UPI00384ED697